MPTPDERKKEGIRKLILSLLHHHPQEEREEKSLLIWKRLKNLDFFQEAKVVMFYFSLPEEVNTHFMIEEALKMGKIVLLPRVEKKEILPLRINNLKRDVFPGCFGIGEPRGKTPFPEGEIELVIVPGVAFDEEKNRLGRGRGYYDRFLKKIPRTKSVGLAFDFQLFPHLPTAPLDRKVSFVLTEKRFIS